MYILTFNKPRSKHFQKALNHLITMGGSWDGETAILTIPEEQILTAYEDLLVLFGYIQKWTNLKATFRGKPVRPYRFLFLVWNTVNRCKMEKERTKDLRHCWSACDSKGWGCKHLHRIQLRTNGPSRYKTSNRYWYNFGEFVSENVWKVNKPLLLEKLEGEVSEKALFLCPFFRVEDIKQVIDNLPEFIRMDKIHFTPYHTAGYRNGEKVMVPVNIRHVAPRKDMATMQDIIQKDPGQYQWN